MSTGSFKKPLDPRKLASQGAIVKGTIGGAMLDRLSDAVLEGFAPIEVELEFHKDADGHALIAGKVTGNVQIQCQRCLDAVDHAIETNFDVRPVLTDAQAQAHQKNVDVVMLDAEGQLDAVAMIEDELLLELPIVIYHDYDCLPVTEFGEPEVVQEQQDAQQENPFAILATMSRRDKEE